MYKKAVASFWTVEEVDLSQDNRDWDRLSGETGALNPKPPPPMILPNRTPPSRESMPLPCAWIRGPQGARLTEALPLPASRENAR